MLNFLDDERVERFYLRLNEPLRRMPAPERAELHQELRQHLETLAAAHLELDASPEEAIEAALRSFGDPAIVGRKLMREWRLKNRDPFWVTVGAIGASQFALNALLFCLIVSSNNHRWLVDIHFSQMFNLASFLIPVLGGIMAGFRLPERAFSAAFASGLIASSHVLLWIFYAAVHGSYGSLPNFSVPGTECLAAYVVSSIKRRDWTLQIR